MNRDIYVKIWDRISKQVSCLVDLQIIKQVKDSIWYRVWAQVGWSTQIQERNRVRDLILSRMATECLDICHE